MTRRPKDTPPTAMGVLKAFWRMAFALLVYPICLGLFFYIWIKGYHWGWGALIVAIVLILDPTWLLILKNLTHSKKKPPKA